MGIRFASASSQRLTSTSLVSASLPFTVGYWSRPITVVVNDARYSLVASASDIGFEITSDGTTASTASILYWNGTIDSGNTNVTGAYTAGAWTYTLARIISATNRRLDIIKPSGEVAQAQNTTSVTAGTLTRHCIGALGSSIPADFFDGTVAEWFFCGTDIVPGGGATPPELVRQIAYRGPFSVPLIVANLHEYRALRVDGGSRDDTKGDTFSLRNTSGPWTYTGSPTTAEHPPLIEPYQRAAPLFPRIFPF